MDLSTHLHTARRATVGRSVLGWAALGSLLLSGAFWFFLFLGLLNPPSLLSPQTIQAALMVVAYAVILPLFWSMLAPSSPAGRLLQKTQWATPGYMATIAAALFLTYHAGRIMLAWWSLQPAVADTHEAVFLAITSLIAGVLVPALCWTVVTPEQWVAQIEQARNVKRIEHAMRMEEAAMRAAYARAVSIMSADLSNIAIQERRELAAILGGFARMQQRALKGVATSWKEMYGIEAAIRVIPDQELLDGYQKVADLLSDGENVMSRSADYADKALAFVGDRQRHGSPHDVAPPLHDSSALPRQMSRDTTGDMPPRHVGQDRTVSDMSLDDDTLSLVARELSPGWTSKELGQLIRRDQRTAQRKIARWLDAGQIEEVEPGRYEVTITRGA